MSRNIDPLQAAFSELEESAQRLNTASDRTNKILSAAQQRLIGTNIGLEVWLTKRPLDEDEKAGGSGQWATSHGTRTVLGFSKIEGSWMLAVRDQTFEHGFFEGDQSSPYFEIYSASDPSPLLKAPRGHRIAALALLPSLIEELKLAADNAYNTIVAHEPDAPPRPPWVESAPSVAPRSPISPSVGPPAAAPPRSPIPPRLT